MHKKRISEAEALAFRKTGLDSQGYPVPGVPIHRVDMNRVQYSEFEMPASLSTIEGSRKYNQDAFKGSKLQKTQAYPVSHVRQSSKG